MELEKITNNNFDMFYQLLEEDFIYDERRTYKDQLDLLKNTSFNCYNIFDKNLKQNIGYICYWNFEDFIFGEHFAIHKDLRDQGYGTKFFKEIFLNTTKPIIIEVEKPNNSTRKRRLKFYKKLGFKILDKNYIQPSYHNSSESIPMFLIGYNVNKNLNLKECVSKIKATAYKINI